MYEFLMGTDGYKYNLMNSLEVLVQFIGVLLLIIIIGLTLKALKQSEENNNEILERLRYDSIDRLYFDINKLVIEFGDKISVPGSGYERYALLTYNFIETVFDTVTEAAKTKNTKAEDQDLWDTWSVIIKQESIKHKDWLKDSKNVVNFKPSFLEFLEKRYIRELNGKYTPPKNNISLAHWRSKTDA